MSGLPYSQPARNRKLAARPKCEMEWRVIWSLQEPEGSHEHRCVIFKGHAGRTHRCVCGASTERKQASRG